jgi:NADH:ubiquinone oxidoreductase subunit 6 (subunit J)
LLSALLQAVPAAAAESITLSGGLFKGVMFVFVAVTVIMASLLVMTQRDIVRAATALFIALGAVAGLYLFLGAEFLAFVQVMVYVGGTTVLIMFGVMLTAREPVELPRAGSARGIVGVVAFVLVLLPLVLILTPISAAQLISSPDWMLASGAQAPQATRNLGDMLLTSYISPFIIASFVLLIALVGAAYIVRRREEPEDAEPADDAGQFSGGQE